MTVELVSVAAVAVPVRVSTKVWQTVCAMIFYVELSKTSPEYVSSWMLKY